MNRQADPKTPFADENIRFVFLGDITLGGEFVRHCKKCGFDQLYPFDFVESYLSEVDILFLNLEGPISEWLEEKSAARLPLSNSPKIVNLFSDRGTIPVFNLANNHIMDYGPEALSETLTFLNNNNIYHVGAGLNSIEANQPLVIKHKNKRIAFVAYVSPYTGAIIADVDKPGCASLSELDKIIETIRDLKRSVDTVCVSLHWGHEFFYYPAPEQVHVAHSMVDAGASYIIGHHPHSIQGIEKYKESLIIYSIGNSFLPPMRLPSGRLLASKKEFKEFMFVKSIINKNKDIKYDILGGKMNNDCQLIPYSGRDYKKFIDLMQKISAPLSGYDYESFWHTYKAKREIELLRESIIEAIKKPLHMSVKDLIKTITVDDLKRNIDRLRRFIKTKNVKGPKYY